MDPDPAGDFLLDLSENEDQINTILYGRKKI
jgi:hypothetical protein